MIRLLLLQYITPDLLSLLFMDKNKQLIGSLKNCTDYVLSIYKLANFTPKMQDKINDVGQYCKNLQKLLKKIVGVISKNMVNIHAHDRVKDEIAELQIANTKLVRENKDYRCELDVLQTKIREAEETETKLRQRLITTQKVSQQFEIKVNKIRKQSQEGLRKIIETSKHKKSLSQRKNSLPIINSYTNNQKLGLLFLMESPDRKHRANRLVEHLHKKY